MCRRAAGSEDFIMRDTPFEDKEHQDNNKSLSLPKRKSNAHSLQWREIDKQKYELVFLYICKI